MLYTIYKITNLIDGKIYIGKHQTENIDDSYYGSGKAVVNAMKKYGKENFKKEVLYVFDNETEMNDKERELINEDFVSRSDTYNIGIGGEGGPHFRGKKHSQETIEKIRESKISRKFDVEARSNMSKAQIKRVEEGKNNFCTPGLKRKTKAPFKGRKHSPESIIKMVENRRRNKMQRQEVLGTVS